MDTELKLAEARRWELSAALAERRRRRSVSNGDVRVSLVGLSMFVFVKAALWKRILRSVSGQRGVWKDGGQKAPIWKIDKTEGQMRTRRRLKECLNGCRHIGAVKAGANSVLPDIRGDNCQLSFNKFSCSPESLALEAEDILRIAAKGIRLGALTEEHAVDEDWKEADRIDELSKV